MTTYYIKFYDIVYNEMVKKYILLHCDEMKYTEFK